MELVELRYVKLLYGSMPIGIFRMFTGSDGESVMEELQEDDPIVESKKTCTGCSLQINEQSEFHPAPRRRWMTMLSAQIPVRRRNNPQFWPQRPAPLGGRHWHGT